MDIEEIKALFPLEGEVTQEMLDTLDPFNSTYCYGGVALRKALASKGYIPKADDDVQWEYSLGHIFLPSEYELGMIRITTSTGLNIPRLTTPTKFTFTLR